MGSTDVRWYVEDASGNMDSCDITILVLDTQDPTISCVTPAVSYVADPTQCYYTTSGTEFDPTSTADNCLVSSVTNSINSLATLDGVQFNVGSTGLN